MEGVVRGNVCPIASTLAAIVAPAIVVQKRQKHKSGPHFFFSSGDDKFIQWLRECREGGIQVKTSKSSQTDLFARGWILSSQAPKQMLNNVAQVNLSQVKAKVGEILARCGQQDVEKTCKWFLLWHNRFVCLFISLSVCLLVSLLVY